METFYPCLWSQLLHSIQILEMMKIRSGDRRHGDISLSAATNRFTQSTVNYLHRPPPLQLFTRIVFTMQLVIKTKTRFSQVIINTTLGKQRWLSTQHWENKGDYQYNSSGKTKVWKFKTRTNGVDSTINPLQITYSTLNCVIEEWPTILTRKSRQVRR